MTVSSSQRQRAYILIATDIWSLPGLTTVVEPNLALAWIKGAAIGVLVSTFLMVYSEVLFLGTRSMYLNGKLQRYYPLPKERGLIQTWVNTMSFTVPTAIYSSVYLPGNRSFSFNPVYFVAYHFAYMVIHDTYFYWCHRMFHVVRPLYNALHAMHHEYSYSMHVYIVGHAELVENFIQVGLPLCIWTRLSNNNWWYWLGPVSFVIFSTLIGHSGYRSHPRLLVFHPMAAPIAYVSGKLLLTVGDHQMHHSHRRVNFGLFWNFWDKTMGTYRKCAARAHDIHYWDKWAKNTTAPQHDEQAKKWLGKNQVEFEELNWGF